MRKNNMLPIGLELASKSISLDKIKIIPTDYEMKPKHTLKTLNFFGWRKRLVNRCVEKINNDIDTLIEKDKNLKFYVYIMGKIYRKNIIFVCLDSHYEIK